MNLPQISVRRIKRKLVLLIKNARHIAFLFVFACVVIQPQNFMIEVTPSTDLNSVHASYAQLLEQSKHQDGTLLFDAVSISGDGKTSIKYKVTPGDTLSSIAQDFGTTVGVLKETNGLNGNEILSVGKTLVISFTENYVYQVQEDSTLEAFASKYNLNVQDLMNLNYLTPPSVQIHAGQELVLPLTRAEAKEKGLIGAEEFVPIDLTSVEDEEIPEEEEQIDEEVIFWTPRVEDGEQEVITAEQTEEHLKNLAEQAKQDAAAQKRYAEEKEKQAALIKKKEKEPIAKPTKPTNDSCPANQCMFKNQCRTKPANSYCAEPGSVDAWKCKAGFVDTGKSCVTPQTAKKATKTTKEAVKKVGQGVISSRYFNARKSGYPYNGWAPGQCTQYVDYRRWKNFGKQTNFRGNARHWLKSAASAGRTTSKTPKYGAAAVMGADRYNGVYGHVAVVIDIDWANSLVLIEEQNYLGSYVVSQRRIGMYNSGILGYIYP